MPVISDTQIAAVAINAGWTGNDAVIAVAVALAESGGNTEATNSNTNGSTDYGLWQMNTIHAGDDSIGTGAGFFPPGVGWKNPIQNALAAHSLQKRRGNWGDWTTYNNKAFGVYLPRGQAAVAANPGIPGVSGSSPSILQQNLNELQVALGLVAQAGGAPNNVGLTTDPVTGAVTSGSSGLNPKDLLPDIFAGLSQYLWIGGGAVLVILGFLILNKNTIASVAKVAAL